MEVDIRRKRKVKKAMKLMERIKKVQKETEAALMKV